MEIPLILNRCRICLDGNANGRSIFEKYNEKYLPDIVRNISGIEILSDDGMTQMICFCCAEMLVKSQDIRKKCLDSDAYLRSHFSQLKADSSQYTGIDSLKKIDNSENISLWKKGIEENSIIESNQIENELQKELDKILMKVNIDDSEDSFKYEENGIHIFNDDELKQEDSSNQLTEENVMNNKMFTCKICSKKFSTETNHNRHKKCHFSNKTKCPICRREFLHKSNLKRHLSIHKNKSLTCDKCNKVFNDSNEFYKHLKIHNKSNLNEIHEEYILICEFCNNQTTSLANYLSHMKDKHDIEETKPFKCRICNLKLASKQGLLRHIDNIHENNRQNLRNRNRNFLCGTCGKKFYTNFHLQVHIRSHTGERPFKCDSCDKSFTQFSGLKMHTFTHTGEKPFPCQICGKTFSQYGHVREHLLTHSDTRPHVCKICNHSFRVKGNLTAHIQIHTGTKPFSCAYCPKAFTHNTKLKLHIKKDHPNVKIEFE